MGNTTSVAPPLISIVGLSGSGKTTLVEKVISLLTERGLRVGTLKHSCHPHPLDVKGKDSWRHKEAGAVRTLFVGPERLQLVSDVEKEENPIELSNRFMKGLDIVIVEGFLHGESRKIEVVRSERSTEPASTIEEGLIAIVSDLKKDELGGEIKELPIFNLNDINAVVDFIQTKMEELNG